MATLHRIDVHRHVSPPSYLTAIDRGNAQALLPRWR
jgi:hypothetical protein